MRNLKQRPSAGLGVLFLLSTLLFVSCSSSSRVSTGVGFHRTSGGNWGHSISVGIHGRR